MGDIGAAFRAEPGAIGANPASVAGIPALAASFIYDNLYLDTSIYYAGAAFPFKNLTVGMTYLWYDGGDFKINYPEDLSLHRRTIKAMSEHLISAVLAGQLTEKLAGGISARYLYSGFLEDYKFDTFTADLGLVFNSGVWSFGVERIHTRPWSEGLGLGISLKNIFGETGYFSEKDSLEKILRAGMVYRIRFNREAALTTGVDFLYSGADGLRPSLGLEYNHANILMLRTGYIFTEGANRMSFGIGLGHSGLRADYGFLPSSAMNHRHLLMFSFSL